MLRDRIICGINDMQTQKRLLAEKNLTFAKAREIALALESAVQGTRDIQTPSGTTVHKVADGNKLNSYKCYRCGKTNHKAPQCRHKNTVCNKCNKTGHLAKVCQSKKDTTASSSISKKQLSTHVVTEQSPSEEKEEYSLFTIHGTKGVKAKTDPLFVTVNLNGKQVSMELDTGSAVTIMAESKFKEISSDSLQESAVDLCTYSGEQIQVKGEAMCNVEYEGKHYVLPIVVISGNGPTLLGRSWLQHIPLIQNWPNIFQTILKVDDKLSQLLHSFSDVFRDELGTLKDEKVSIHFDPSVPPKFCKARSLPYAMREKVEKELQHLQDQGIISPVKYSKWAAPIVPVLKQDKTSVRICGDYKLTANRASHLEHYPLPKVDDLFTALTGGTMFTKLDMNQAYLQLTLDDQSKELLTINTHKGLFAYNRVPFEVSSAPGIFQRTIEFLLKGIPNVLVYLDDILVTGPTQEQHIHNLQEVLLCFRQYA